MATKEVNERVMNKTLGEVMQQLNRVLSPAEHEQAAALMHELAGIFDAKHLPLRVTHQAVLMLVEATELAWETSKGADSAA